MYKADFKWPDGAYIAVVFNMSWEVSPNLGTVESNTQKAPANAPYARAMRPVYENAFADSGCWTCGSVTASRRALMSTA